MTGDARLERIRERVGKATSKETYRLGGPFADELQAVRADIEYLLSLIDAAKGMAEAINGNQGSDGDCCKALATFTKLLNEETTR